MNSISRGGTNRQILLNFGHPANLHYYFINIFEGVIYDKSQFFIIPLS